MSLTEPNGASSVIYTLHNISGLIGAQYKPSTRSPYPSADMLYLFQYATLLPPQTPQPQRTKIDMKHACCCPYHVLVISVNLDRPLDTLPGTFLRFSSAVFRQCMPLLDF